MESQIDEPCCRAGRWGFGGLPRLILYFLRHGDAGQRTTGPDNDTRELTAAGQASLRAAAPIWRRVNLRDGTLCFERQFQHGLKSTPPNIDVALDINQSRPLGIESKFTEPYGPKKDHPCDSKRTLARAGIVLRGRTLCVTNR